MPSDVMSIQKSLQIAMEHHRSGHLSQAEGIYQKILQVQPNQPDALHLMGLIAHQMGKNEIAVDLISKAIAIAPSGSMYSNLGLAFQAQGKSDTAIENYRKALSMHPDDSRAQYNLGVALQSQGKLDRAVTSYQEALSIKPDYAEAYCNLGLIFHMQGKLDRAVTSYQEALSIKPDYAEAYCNLGLIFHMQGKLDAAIENYHKALSINPSHIKTLNRLTVTLLSDGKILEAFDVSKRSLKITETIESKALVVKCIQNIRFGNDYEDADARKILIRAISEPWGRPSDFSASGLSLIRANQNIRECIERAAKAWPRRLPRDILFGPTGPESVYDPLFQCLLENVQLCNSELERFLTMVRNIMLNAAEEAIVSDTLEEKVLTFYCALARQCFINEYVYFYTDEELRKAGLLREQLEAAIESGLPVPVLWLLTVASYFPLFSLRSVEYLLTQSWPESVAALLEQQIREPLEEKKYSAELSRLTDIEDDVSLQVRQQYEENPYPRWVKLPHEGQCLSIDDYVRRQFAFSCFKPMGKKENVDILNAGCGTGELAIQSAQRFCGANVLAVDLSLASLSYAKRKALELGIVNIEYAQADILKIGSIGRKFDLIESVGVLHHLEDPVAGWRELLSLLRPKGFMRLGFYSECARQNVVAARNFIAEQGYVATSKDIRKCRQDLLSMEDTIQFKKLTSFIDFYGTSDCRDLLFHVQEHRFTLPQIKEILGDFDLDFIGFFINPHIGKMYSERFPDDRLKTNLDYWNLFETENPDTFVGMYQFLVQKRC